MQPPKPKTNGLVILFAVLGVLLVCCGLPLGFMGYFGFKGFKGTMEMAGCMVNVEAMREALIKYEQEHGGKMPKAATWQTDLAKYFKQDKDMEGAPMKIWKAGGEWSCEEGSVKTGFAFNESMSEKSAAEMMKKDPHAIAIYETNTIAYNQTGSPKVLPYDQSPKIIGGMIDEHRGWMLVSADGTNLLSWTKDGKIGAFSMGSSGKSRRSKGFNFQIDTNESSDNSSN